MHHFRQDISQNALRHSAGYIKECFQIEVIEKFRPNHSNWGKYKTYINHIFLI